MRNLLDYSGKRVVVTGAASGMGAATAEVVGGLGGSVVAVDVVEPKVDCEAFFEIDLRDVAAIDAGVEAIAGAGAIDALVNCAGLPGQSFPEWDVVAVNFVAMRHMAEQCARRMGRGAAIASVSSGAGMGYLQNLPQVMEFLALEEPAAVRAWVGDHEGRDGFDAYVFSKQCIIVWTLQRAASLTRDTGIRLNCVSPGVAETPMLAHFERNLGAEFVAGLPKPIGRNSRAEEQAWPLAFLCSEAASYVTGANLFADGGTSGGVLTGAIDPALLVPPGQSGPVVRS